MKYTGKKTLALLSLAAIIGFGIASPAQAQDWDHDHRGAPHAVEHREHRDIAWEHHMHDRVWLHSHRHWVYDWHVRRYVWVPYDYVVVSAPGPAVVMPPPPQVVYAQPQPYYAQPVYVAPQPPPYGMNLALHIH